MIRRNFHEAIQLLHPIPVIGWISNDHLSWRLKVKQGDKASAPAWRDHGEQFVIFENELVLAIRINVIQLGVRFFVVMLGPMRRFGNS